MRASNKFNSFIDESDINSTTGNLMSYIGTPKSKNRTLSFGGNNTNSRPNVRKSGGYLSILRDVEKNSVDQETNHFWSKSGTYINNC